MGVSNLPCWVAATVAVLLAVLAGDKAGRGPTLARQPPIYNRLGVGRGGGEGPGWGQSHLLWSWKGKPLAAGTGVFPRWEAFLPRFLAPGLGPWPWLG